MSRLWRPLVRVLTYFSGLLDWWNNLPLGYSELHVPAHWSRERVRDYIRENFAYRLPQEPRARAMRIGILLDQHCFWQKFTGTHDQRPHVDPVKCRRTRSQ